MFDTNRQESREENNPAETKTETQRKPYNATGDIIRIIVGAAAFTPWEIFIGPKPEASVLWYEELAEKFQDPGKIILTLYIVATRFQEKLLSTLSKAADIIGASIGIPYAGSMVKIAALMTTEATVKMFKTLKNLVSEAKANVAAKEQAKHEAIGEARGEARGEAIGEARAQAKAQAALAQQESLFIARHRAIAEGLIDDFPQLAEHRDNIYQRFDISKEIDHNDPQ